MLVVQHRFCLSYCKRTNSILVFNMGSVSIIRGLGQHILNYNFSLWGFLYPSHYQIQKCIKLAPFRYQKPEHKFHFCSQVYFFTVWIILMTRASTMCLWLRDQISGHYSMEIQRHHNKNLCDISSFHFINPTVVVEMY